MNYQKIYNDIIEKAAKQNRIKYNNIYYESHHIIPRCLNGSDEKQNKVLLTAREHFVCHKLLTYIYKGNRKIACAYHKLAYSNTGNHIKTSRDYAYARELISLTLVSEETRKKQSESHLGMTHTIESIEKIAASKRGIPRSEETKNKCRDAQIGKPKNFNKEFLKKQSEKYKEYNTKNKKGKTYEYQMIEKYGEELGLKKVKEYKEKLTQSKLGKKRAKILCPYCRREISDNNYNRYHSDNCKFKK